MDQDKVGSFIKKLRIDNNLTQKELANKLNITFQAVSKWENGKSVPDISQLQEISKLFNVDISEILEGELKVKKRKIVLPIIISILVVLFVLLLLFINNKSDFAFKRITTYDTSFNVVGSLAYDDKGKIYIYISNIDYDTEDVTIYKTLKVTLYESYKGNNTKVKDSDMIRHDMTIKEYLKDVTFNIDDYKSSCDDLSKSNFYIEVSATNNSDVIIYFKIPLELEDICPEK